MELLGYMASFFMGLSLGLIGGGGSILTVPILVYLFSVEPIKATSMSLFIVGSTAFAGALLALRKRDVQIKTTLYFALPSLVGVYLTKSILIPNIPEIIFTYRQWNLSKSHLIMGIFSVLMLLASRSMIKRRGSSIKEESIQITNLKSKSVKNETHKEPTYKVNSIYLWIQGFFIGGVTGLVGAGGGFLIVPALVTMVGLSMRSAIGTSLLIIALNSLFGFSMSLKSDINFDWKLLLVILMIALLGLVLGSRLSHKVPEKKLKLGFGYFVLIMGSFILIDQLRKM